MTKIEVTNVLLYPLMTEKAVSLIETENKITFIVKINSDKRMIKHAFEELYEVKVSDINVVITPRGQKKAYIKLNADHNASDLAIRLGIL
jgi:large subunit ribosomal protein L23